MYIIVCNPNIDADSLIYFQGLKGYDWPERDFFEWCEELDVAYIMGNSGKYFIAPSTSDGEAAYIRSLLPVDLKNSGSGVIVYRSSGSFVPYMVWNYIDKTILEGLCDLLVDPSDTDKRHKIKMIQGDIFDNAIIVTSLEHDSPRHAACADQGLLGSLP
jgi:hypothetical protein